MINLFLASTLIYVSLWEYMMIMYKIHPNLPYRSGYNAFSILQWPVICIGLVKIFGWAYGIASLIFVMALLQYITHFTLGLLYNKIFKNPLIPLVLFSVMFWVNIIMTILLFVFE
jgi:hypothetical protein